MKIEKLFAVFVTSAVLQTMSVFGQDTSSQDTNQVSQDTSQVSQDVSQVSSDASGDDVFRVSFTGSVRPGTGNAGQAKLTNRDLIEQCTGPGSSLSQINRNFALVYNATQDKIQVLNRSDGSVVCDLFQFQGGTSRIVRGQLVRLTFVFAESSPDSVGATAFCVGSIAQARKRARVG